jgi:hypothetical protein
VHGAKRTFTVQPGQRLILGTLQSGLKPPRASANPVADTVDASNVKQKTMREVWGMGTSRASIPAMPTALIRTQKITLNLLRTDGHL